MRARAASAVALAFSAVFSASSFAFARVSRAVSPRGFIIFLHQGFVIGRIGRLIMDVRPQPVERGVGQVAQLAAEPGRMRLDRSEEHTSELQSLMRISYAVFCL